MSLLVGFKSSLNCWCVLPKGNHLVNKRNYFHNLRGPCKDNNYTFLIFRTYLSRRTELYYGVVEFDEYKRFMSWTGKLLSDPSKLYT